MGTSVVEWKRASDGWNLVRGDEVLGTIRPLVYAQGWFVRVRGVPWVKAADTFNKVGTPPYPGTARTKNEAERIIVAVVNGEDPWERRRG